MASMHRHFAKILFCLCAVVATAVAQALPYTGLVVFGDSLSDAGNNAFVFDGAGLSQTPPLPPGTLRTPTPVASGGFIPLYPYASNRYSNGPVWVENLAVALGLPALAPSLAGGSDFAFGGATTGPAGSSFPFSLRDQVAQFLAATSGLAPAGNLYIVAGGGNDARNALQGSPANLPAAIAQFVANEMIMINALLTAGARDILLVNIPDIGKTPALLAAGAAASLGGTQIAAAMNAALDAALGALALGADQRIIELDAFGLVNAVAADPAAFGFGDVTTACAASAACIAAPSTSFFWDGIHPTAAAHALIGQVALAAIPLPATSWLVVLGLLALIGRRRPQRA